MGGGRRQAGLGGGTPADFVAPKVPPGILPAEIAGRNRMMRRMITDSIRNDPEWQGGEYKHEPRGLTSAIYTLIFMVSSPRQWQKQAPTRAAGEQLFDGMVGHYLKQLDPHHLPYPFHPPRDNHPAPDLEK